MKNLLEIFILLCWLAITIALLFSGIDVCQQLVAKHAVSAGQRIPLVFVNAALPVSAAIVGIRLIIELLSEGRKLLSGGEA